MPDAENDPADAAHLRETVDAAAALLARTSGRPLSLEVGRNFRGPRARSTVLRCRVLGDGGPGSVIVKRFRGAEGGPYEADDGAAAGSRARLLNEWAGARFLEGLATERPFGPACYAGDGRLGLVLLEDLGEGPCLADLLQGDDASAAEAALVAYAATLGRLHAASAGRERRYAALRAGLAAGGTDPPPWDAVREWRREALSKFRAACADLDLPIPAAAEAELAAVAAAVADPGPFLAYSVSDTCPDNHRYLAGRDGETGSLRFFDMEFGGFRHALLDAAYLWLPFPTCWCVNRLPDDLPPRLEAAYRAELVRGCPAAADERGFARALAAAGVVWLVLTLSWDFARVQERDDDWGIATVRQRMPLRAGNVARLCGRAGDLPALEALAADFAGRLRARWGPAVEMPLYPPFRP